MSTPHSRWRASCNSWIDFVRESTCRSGTAVRRYELDRARQRDAPAARRRSNRNAPPTARRVPAGSGAWWLAGTGVPSRLRESFGGRRWPCGRGRSASSQLLVALLECGSSWGPGVSRSGLPMVAPQRGRMEAARTPRPTRVGGLQAPAPAAKSRKRPSPQLRSRCVQGAPAAAGAPGRIGWGE